MARKAIEQLAHKYVYAQREERRFQLDLSMRRTFGRKATNKAIDNAFEIQRIVDPKFQRFV